MNVNQPRKKLNVAVVGGGLVNILHILLLVQMRIFVIVQMLFTTIRPCIPKLASAYPFLRRFKYLSRRRYNSVRSNCDASYIIT